jgi:hypothetical protein
MSENIRTLRPGVLVSAKTRVNGGVDYYKQDIEYAHPVEGGAERSAWNTTKVVFDPEEHKAATQVAGKARYLIAKLCAKSDHGLLCPDKNVGELQAAIAEGRELCREFNATAVHTRVDINVICGRVVADDVEATRALFSETENFLAEIAQGLKELDAKKVRALCSKVLDVGQMLAPNANTTVANAVKIARAEATKIVKAGEQVAIQIDESTLNAIGAARNSFLDFDLDDDVDIEAAAPVARAIDFDEAAS